MEAVDAVLAAADCVAALGVADQDPTEPDVLDHLGGDLAREGAALPLALARWPNLAPRPGPSP